MCDTQLYSFIFLVPHLCLFPWACFVLSQNKKEMSGFTKAITNRLNIEERWSMMNGVFCFSMTGISIIHSTVVFFIYNLFIFYMYIPSFSSNRSDPLWPCSLES